MTISWETEQVIVTEHSGTLLEYLQQYIDAARVFGDPTDKIVIDLYNGDENYLLRDRSIIIPTTLLDGLNLDESKLVKDLIELAEQGKITEDNLTTG